MITIISNILGSPFYLFHALSLILVGYWVYLDATERGSNMNYLWAIGCTLFQPLTVGYLLYRSEIGGRTRTAGTLERIVGTFVVGHLVTIQLWFVLGYMNVVTTITHPPLVELQYYIALFVVGVIPGYWLVWKSGWARTRRKLGWVQEAERTNIQS
ncbi:hypothetical protein [Halorubrum sp. AJ67]|uniref:hypothetical protein n=1 Tax=Halorubrum sp. AJ67 TaxID=1173487 RepID=UPI0003DB9FC0|nr:hypothetical protein [Halorubrum sp. AJ67]CDK39748.1 uncharacterized protein BN903_147 [Halorubrum sp. AJ67]